MKPKMRTPEWLSMTRNCAGLSQVELAKLAGLKSTIIVSLYETGSQTASLQAWEALEDVLRPLAPLMFVDEDAIIASAEAGALWEKEGALCRLPYAPGRHGIAFTGIKPVEADPPDSPCITVPISEALDLLKAQRAAFANEPAKPVLDEEAAREGAKLRKMREALGLNQRDMARRLSSTQPAISLMERGVDKNDGRVKRYRELLERLTADRRHDGMD